MKTKRAQGRKGRNVLGFFKMTLKIFLKTKRAQGRKGRNVLGFFKMTLKIFSLSSNEKGRDVSKKGAIGCNSFCIAPLSNILFYLFFFLKRA